MPSPRMRILGRQGRFEVFPPDIQETRAQYARRMQGRFVGTMPLALFKKNYFPASLVAPKDLPTIDFTPCLEANNELELQHTWTRCVSMAQITSKVETINSGDKKRVNTERRPDIVFQAVPAGEISRQWASPGLVIKERCDYSRVLALLEVKQGNSLEGFEDYHAGMASCENGTNDGRSSRGQLAMYAGLRFSRQHLRFQFLVSIAGGFARFHRFDRAGDIVTQDFNYIKEPHHISEFLWMLGEMTGSQLGFDETATLASEAEQELFTSAMTAYKNNGERKPEKYTLVDPDYPIYKVSVANGDEDSTAATERLVDTGTQSWQFLICTPFYEELSTPGRGTRGYIAYDLKKQEMKFLKDSWAPSDNSVLSETSVLRTLHADGNSISPRLHCGGLVVSDEHPNGQTTLTDKLPDLYRDAEWLAPCSPLLRGLEHQRVVEEIALPLTTLTSSRQLVKVFRDIILGVDASYKISKLLHIDIHPGNVMLTGDTPNGKLVDWDHVVKADSHLEGGVDYIVGTATWQVMPISLLRQHGVPREYEIVHAHEQLFWTFLKFAVHHCAHSHLGLVANSNNLFDEWIEVTRPNGRLDIEGGMRKRALLDDMTFKNFPFTARPLRDLVGTWSEKLRVYHMFENSVRMGRTHAEFDEAERDLSNAQVLADMLGDAYDRPDWPTDPDIVADQFPPKGPSAQVRASHRDDAIGNIQDTPALDQNAKASTIAQIKRQTVHRKSSRPSLRQLQAKSKANKLKRERDEIADPPKAAKKRKTNHQRGDENTAV